MNQALIAEFGNPVFESTQDGWCVPDVHWCNKNLVPMFIGNIWILMHSQTAEAWGGIRPTIDVAWVTEAYAWSPRHQLLDPARPLSRHAWGLAIDFNWTANPLGAKTHNIPEEFIKTMESNGFVWGGRWRSRDWHHFELAICAEENDEIY